MTTIAGIDLSLVSAGVAVVTDATGAACPTVLTSCGRTGREGETYKQRSRRVRKQVFDLMKLLDPAGKLDMAVIEGPIYGGTFTGSYFDRAGLFHGVYGALDSRNVPIAVIPPTTGHIFTTGKGSLPKDPRAFKPLILESVQKLLPDRTIANDDQADALGLAWMGAMSLGIKMPFRAQRWQYEAVHTAVWPHGKPVRYG
jgi:Holliday junction resolvasome RuvABC endonuclease subunit